MRREHRSAIAAGDPLTFPGKEPCPLEVGDEIPVKTAKVRSIEGGEVTVPLVTITVHDIRRTRKGDYRIFYITTDHRPRLLRRTPPAHDPNRAQRDHILPPDRESIRQAGQESGYTTSPRQAILDAGEAVPEHYQRRLTLEARRKDAERIEDIDRRRQAERSVRAQLREALQGLNPQGQMVLLARIKRTISEVQIEDVA